MQSSARSYTAASAGEAAPQSAPSVAVAASQERIYLQTVNVVEIDFVRVFLLLILM